MVTIKLPYQTSNSNRDYILLLIRQQNSAVKYLFNRIRDSSEKLTQIELTGQTRKINNVDLLEKKFFPPNIT